MLENGDYIEPLKYDVDGFVADAVSLKITPFMLVCYRHEYEDMVVCEFGSSENDSLIDVRTM